MKIRVVIADDHPSIVAGVHHELSAHPDLQIVGMARDFDELLGLLDTHT
ncbi:hypothetical protein H0484_11860 [Pusillimonas sp. CC-YST705]|uniref:Response regulatory domain-containing protein n=1 Tax=Mesopusillimonas faecipullorum TaxID=2755040 RepID=A0ABS8CEH1_9BURK|nr:hypothetical protein [Mesopusillimonas faecipullorum]MCB5364441.1 hypothetical protein [Mesopusillimonas faecipullorum]